MLIRGHVDLIPKIQKWYFLALSIKSLRKYYFGLVHKYAYQLKSILHEWLFTEAFHLIVAEKWYICDFIQLLIQILKVCLMVGWEH